MQTKKKMQMHICVYVRVRLGVGPDKSCAAIAQETHINKI